MDVISRISLILGIVLSVISIVTIIVTAIRRKRDNSKALAEGMKALLRSEMEKMYYKNLSTQTLREYERKSLDSLYNAYHNGLHGNTFADDLYEEMRDWQILR